MAHFSAAKLKEAFGVYPVGVSDILTRALVDFGYLDLTGKWVEAEMNRLIAGGGAESGPGMFLDGWLKDGIEIG